MWISEGLSTKKEEDGPVRFEIVASSSADVQKRKLTRRGFVKLAGALVAVAAIAPSKIVTAAASVGSSPSNTSGVDPAPVASRFSIFWITDTQFLSESNPSLFRRMTDWIASKWVPYNGKMVIHTGDIVQTGIYQDEWENADQAMSTLLKNGIPYTWCAGNHDDWAQDDASSGWAGNRWTNAFNPSVVSDKLNGLEYFRWVGDYRNGMNTAASFSANGLNFLVVNLEWNAGPDVLKWVESLLDDPTYENHYAIIAPHAYIDWTGNTNNLRWAYILSSFETGLTAIINKHSSNVFLTLNGHFATDCGFNTPTPTNNRNELMFDRQDCTDDPKDPTGRGIDVTPSGTPNTEKVGGATVTVLTFDTVYNRIVVGTYDVYTGKWRHDPAERYEVTMFPTVFQNSGNHLPSEAALMPVES